MLTVLFSSAGRRVELINCFRADARRVGVDLRVLAVDSRPQLSAACHSADAAFPVPRCSDAQFIPIVREICRRERVDLLVPTIDTELPAYAASAAQFAQEGTRVVVSSPEVVAIARDKARTAEVFANAGVSVPHTGSVAELLSNPGEWAWPLIVKPASGSSSIGVQTVHSLAEVRAAAANRSDLLVQELWVGCEYTVNVFVDHTGQLVTAVPHRRVETRGGEVSKGVTERVPVLAEAARRIAAALPGARGALCFQAIVRDDGAAGIFELNARFGGGYPLAHRAGARFPEWLLQEHLGLTVPSYDGWTAGVTMLRYDAAVFTGPAETA